MQTIAARLVQGNSTPLGQYLLGATYRMLHEVAVLEQKSIGNFKSPWWFLQLWRTVYTTKVANLHPFIDNSFPISFFAKGATPILSHCASLGEATSDVPGAPLSVSRLLEWFKSFYHGFDLETIICHVYSEPLDFDVQSDFNKRSNPTDGSLARFKPNLQH
jgi:hypothetical protein